MPKPLSAFHLNVGQARAQLRNARVTTQRSNEIDRECISGARHAIDSSRELLQQVDVRANVRSPKP